MVNIVNVSCDKIEFSFGKQINNTSIKLRSGLNNNVFYETYFGDVSKDTTYWVGHPRFYIENKIYLEVYENDKITYAIVVGENLFNQNSKHISNIITDIDSNDIIEKYNDSFFEVFIDDNFDADENHSYIYDNVKNFIDLGGNCGFFSRKVFNTNNNARGVIVEPNPNLKEVICETNKNFNYVLKSMAFGNNNGDIVSFNIANSFNNTAVSHQSNIDIGFTPSVNDFTEHQIETINMEGIMSEFNDDDIIDILKVDIEGGEQHLNSTTNKSIIKERVKYILIETHSDEIENKIKNTFTDTFDIVSENKSTVFNHIIFKNKNLTNSNTKKILFKVPSPAMGDTLCSTPTIRKLYESYGHKIDVMAVRDDVLKGSPYINNLLKFENEVSGYDEVFDGFVRSVKVNKNMDAHTFHDTPIEIKLSNFEARQIHALSLGITLYPEEMNCDFFPDEPTEKSNTIDEKCIVLHVTESWPNRTWEVKKWQRLIDLIKENTDLKVVTIGKSHSEHGHHGVIEKRVVRLNNVDYDFTENDEVRDQVFQNGRDSLSEMWHILNNSFGLVSFDSGPIHLAGTTDSWIFQIGASIRPEKTAPWRHSSQKYKFDFVGGECKIFCGSCPKYSVKEWGTINSMPYYPECLEGYDEFKCQPSPDEVFFNIMKRYNEENHV